MEERDTPEIGWDRHPVVGGIEIFLDDKADEAAKHQLLARGWRWSNSTRSWYNRDTPENAQFAGRFCDKFRPQKPR
jgi:hypothetical protein